MYTSFLHSDILTALLLLPRDGYVQSGRLETDLCKGLSRFRKTLILNSEVLYQYLMRNTPFARCF